MFHNVNFKVHILISVAILGIILINSLYLIFFKKIKKPIRGAIFTIFYVALVIVLMLTKDLTLNPLIRSSVFTNVILLSSIVYGLFASLLAFLILTVYIFISGYQYIVILQLIVITILMTLRLTLINEQVVKNTKLTKVLSIIVINLINLAFVLIYYKTFSIGISGYLVFLFTLPFISLSTLLFVDNQMKTNKEINIVKNEYELLRHSLNSTQAIQVIILDKDLKYVEANDIHKYMMKKLYNVDIEIGSMYTDYAKNERNSDKLLKKMDLAFNGSYEEYTYTTTNGQTLKTFFSGIKNDDNIIDSVVLFTQDITINKQNEEAVHELTYRDTLTNVFNRHYFMDNLDKFRQIENLVLIYIDVNMLKFINDAFGHNYGDILITTVASEALKYFGVDATLIRMGGDEFIVIIEEINESDAKVLLDQFIQRINKKTIIAVQISVSAGLAVKENNKTFEQTMKEAEEKMYNNKLFNYEFGREDLINKINCYLVEDAIVDPKLIEVKKYYGIKLLEKLKLKDDIELFEQLIDNYQLGKISIKREILENSNRSKIERRLYVTYVDLSYRILSSVPKYKDVSDLVIYIEENFDGSGHPLGIKGKQIPLLSQVVNLLNYCGEDLLNNHKNLIEKLPSVENKRIDREIVNVFIDILRKEEEIR